MNVSKDHQRKGIGFKLLSMVLKEAKQLGMGTFLEASSEGTPLYLKARAEQGVLMIIKDREGNVIMKEFCMIWKNYDSI
jgi:GNAT superfamily N-acetyltransferase